MEAPIIRRIPLTIGKLLGLLWLAAWAAAHAREAFEKPILAAAAAVMIGAAILAARRRR